MAGDVSPMALSVDELREVAGFAVACACAAVPLYERDGSDGRRLRDAIDAAHAFADGGRRSKALRDAAWAAHRAAQESRDAGQLVASAAARAAGHAAGAAFLHPLAKGTQVTHILGAAAFAARAFELAGGDDAVIGSERITQFAALANPVVVGVLRRYPVSPGGGGRVGELMRELDAQLR